jgi:hypothetical protein
MDPITASILTQVGITAGGALLNAVFGGKKKAPNYRAQALGAGANALRQLEEQENRRLDRLEGDLAAAGATGFQGVAAREALARSAGDARQSLLSSIADDMARAGELTDIAKTQLHNETIEQRRQAIRGLASAGGTLASNSITQSALESEGAGAAAAAVTGGGVPLLSEVERAGESVAAQQAIMDRYMDQNFGDGQPVALAENANPLARIAQRQTPDIYAGPFNTNLEPIDFVLKDEDAIRRKLFNQTQAASIGY